MTGKSDKELSLECWAVLRLAAYQSFNDRRGYEWKLSFGIWTALAVLIVGLVQPSQPAAVFPFHGQWYGPGATLVGLGVVLLHIYFNNALAQANAIDRAKQRMYEDQIRSLLTFTETETYLREQAYLESLLRKKQAPPKSQFMQWTYWGHRAQVGVTVLLAAVAVCLVWLRASA